MASAWLLPPKSVRIIQRISHENGPDAGIATNINPFQDFLMGVEIPMPPEMINPAAPEGTPPRRIKTVEKIYLPILMASVRTGSVHVRISRADFSKEYDEILHLIIEIVWSMPRNPGTGR